MNYERARVYLDEMSKYGSVLGLESMRALLDRLDNPQDELKFIHISGTNGKGSVLAYLSTILKNAGYCTGRYSSPALFSYRERIQVNDEKIEKDSLAKHITTISHVVEDMRREKEPIPTVFEIETALAFMYFKEKKCDIVVLEIQEQGDFRLLPGCCYDTATNLEAWLPADTVWVLPGLSDFRDMLSSAERLWTEAFEAQDVEGRPQPQRLAMREASDGELKKSMTG